MINDELIKERLANNLTRYRKENNLTQQELAIKLNYSDKSISKWERQESFPDILILAKLAELYGITVNDLLSEESPKIHSKRKLSHLMVTLISVTGVWVIATIAYATLGILNTTSLDHWLVFIYAIPLSMILLIVFSHLWGTVWMQFGSITGLLWGVTISLYFSISVDKIWLLFIIAGPTQLLIIFWYLFRYFRSKNSLR